MSRKPSFWNQRLQQCSLLVSPSHEIMAPFVLSKLILQTRMRSHPVGLDVWFLVGPFVYFLTSSVRTTIWTASSEFGTYRLCEQRRFRRACASAQSHQNLRCSLIQAVSQEEPSDRKPDLWPLWMAGHAQLKFVMTECSKTQIRLTGLIW